MTTANRNLILTLVAGLVIGIAIFALYTAQRGATGATANSNATTTLMGGAATSSTQGSSLASAQAGSGAQVSAQDVLDGLDIQKMIAEARALKNAGKYDAAIAKLNQASAVYPTNTVPYNNLGDIYMHFKKDYVKAELNYKKVVQYDPRQLSAYRSLFELYTTTSYKPTNTAAVDIAAAAVKANPTAYDFQLMAARYYKGIGDTNAARVQYQAAINNAKGQNLASVAAQMQAELDALPQ